jgi:hypothetical protein
MSDLEKSAAVAAGPVNIDTTMMAPTDSNAVTVDDETMAISR